MTPVGWLTVAGAAIVTWILFSEVCARLGIQAGSAFATAVVRLFSCFCAALLVGVVMKQAPELPALPGPVAKKVEPSPIVVPPPPVPRQQRVDPLPEQVLKKTPVKPQEAPPQIPEVIAEPLQQPPAPPPPPVVQHLPTPAAPKAQPVEPCAGLKGLENQVCRACGNRTGLSFMLCESSTRTEYCVDKIGKDPACPASQWNDPG
jgi:hypothetical protein